MQEERPLPAERAARCRPRFPELTETARDRAPPEPSAAGARRDGRARRRRLRVRHDALRADIRRLSTMLGQTLAHHGGPELLELVEQVRRLSRSAVAGDAAATPRSPRCSPAWTPAPRSRWPGRSPSTSSWPTSPSSCTARASWPPARRAAGPAAPADAAAGRLRRRRPRRGAGGAGPGRAAPGVHRAPHRVVPPVGAGHPASGGRRAGPRRRRDEELAALVELLWQTDELRPGKPTVADEARAIGWYLEQLGRTRCPTCSGSSSARSARPGSRCPTSARPLVLGCWVGGDRDGNPNVTPAVTREVMRLYADRALRHPHRPGRRAGPGAVASPPGSSASPRSCAARSPGTGARCPRCTTATSGSTRTSPTGSSSATSGPGWTTPAPVARPRAPHVPGRDYLGPPSTSRTWT